MHKIMMKWLLGSRGLTIIELMVAVALAAVIFFGLATIYMLTMDWWDRGSSLLNLQRDGSYALFEISTDIRRGSMAEISPSTQLRIKDSSGSTIARYYLEGSDNTLRYDSGGLVVPSLVDSLCFAQSGKTVSVLLVLADAEQQEAYFSTAASLRN